MFSGASSPSEIRGGLNIAKLQAHTAHVLQRDRAAVRLFDVRCATVVKCPKRIRKARSDVATTASLLVTRALPTY